MNAPLNSAEILHGLHALRQMGRVLYIAAHPDDENSRFIAHFARALGCATGYLSLTRGDGGQNLLGSELGPALGAIRTQELLVARQIDGGHQFFARAVDFGFSKDHRETLAIWDREQVLADTVRVIRQFQPDILVTRFSPEPGSTHGHHTASTILALDAFAVCGDPAAFPEQVAQGLLPWTPRRVVWNVFQWPGTNTPPIPEGALPMDLGGFLPLAGLSAGEIAAQSRSMHKSQGMGNVPVRGRHVEWFKLLAGEPMSGGLLDGVDTSWARVPGGVAVGLQIDTLIAGFDAFAPARSVPGLLALRSRLASLATSRPVREKLVALERLVVACLGLWVETVVPAGDVVAGEALKLKHVAIARGGHPATWIGVRYADGSTAAGGVVALQPNVPAVREDVRTLPVTAPLTQPYWLAEPSEPGMHTVRDPALIGAPESGPAFPLSHVFEVEGQELVVADEPVAVSADPVRGEQRRSLRVIPPVSLDFVRGLELYAPEAERNVEVQVTAARPELEGEVRLDLPPGWRSEPPSRRFGLAHAGEIAVVDFRVTAPATPAVVHFGVTATAGGVACSRQRIDICYEHIPPVLLQPPATCKAVCLELTTRGRRVGYLPGAGDGVDTALERMGYAVTRLGDADLSAAGLKGLDAVVLGIRAYNTRRELPARMQALFAYCEAGGTVVVQYNTNHAVLVQRPAPADLKLSRDRVTDQAAPVTVLAPDCPVIRGPNRIGPADFEGWVHERGLYFPDAWDPVFTPVLGMADPGEAEKTGSLLVMRHGRGWFVYTGLSFFRQLPAGVPGAYRLFANLVSLAPDSGAA